MNEAKPAAAEHEFLRGLGLLDSTMLVAGSMIGSGIFIVSADIARQVGSTGWLLVAWLVTGALTVSAALSYGELAAMMPRAGGQYVYLREAYSPLWGFLYGWTSFLVIQTGTIAAVAVAFSRYFGVLVPAISPTAWIIPPVNLSANYAVSLSSQQFVAIFVVILLTYINTRGLRIGKLIQNVFTSAKTLSLVALIVVGLLLARNADVIKANFTDLWTPHGVTPVKPDLSFISSISATGGVFGLFVAFCAAEVGSLFSSDAWNNINAMARDGLFFKATGKLNHRSVPGVGLSLQCFWTCLLVLPRTRLRDASGAPVLDPLTGHEQYGNLYSNLLDYVVFAVLIFYVLTIVGLFRLRRTQPNAERPYRAFGYPVIPALYIVVASAIMLVLLLYKTQTTWPGLLIVLAGVPIYFLWKRRAADLRTPTP